MDKIKKLFSKMSIEIKELIKSFPLTMLIIMFLTILGVITIDLEMNENTEQILEKIYMFSWIFGVGTFFSETFFNNKTKKILSYAITGIISSAFSHILLSENAVNEVIFKASKYLAAYVIILILLSIYKTIKKENLKFEEYLLKVARDFFNITVIYIILNIGIMIVTSVFVELILDGEYDSLVEKILLLLFGLYYVSSLVYTISNVNKKEVNSFIKALVIYVFLPLVIIAIAIIYIYMAKIIILRDIPKNMIYRILAGIFLVAFPVWNMASNYSEEKKIIEKITKILPYLYIPFIFLEIYSIGTRINEFGLTPARYMCCAFVVYQIMALFFTFYKKKEKISYVLISLVVLVFIGIVTPLNFENMSNLSQKKIIEKNMPKGTEFENLSEDKKIKVNSAYKYLIKEVNGKSYIPEYLSEEDKEKINEFNKNNSYRIENEGKDNTEYISLKKDLELDIQKYSKITEVSDMVYDESTIKLKQQNKNIDLDEYVKKIIDKDIISEEQAEEYFQENNITKVTNEEDLYISNLYIMYYTDSNKIKTLRVNGYLLEK